MLNLSHTGNHPEGALENDYGNQIIQGRSSKMETNTCIVKQSFKLLEFLL